MSKNKIKLEEINKRILEKLEKNNSSVEEISENIPFFDENIEIGKV